MQFDSNHGTRLTGILLVVCVASFMAVLDVTVVNLAFPDLHRTFTKASVVDLSWVVTLYAVLFSALLAPAGRLADVIGRRWLFAAGIATFTVASVVSATAPELWVLLMARAVQGVGAAAMIPSSLAIVIAAAPVERRSAAVGLWSAAGAFAAAVGPSLGGVLVNAWGWRAVFWINLPIGVGLILAMRVVPRIEAAGGRIPDILGTVLLAGGVGLGVLGVTEGTTWQWTSAKTLACLIGGAFALLLAVLRSTRHSAPAIETQLWKIRSFAFANLVSVLFGAALYCSLLLSVVFLVQVWGYSELKAGLAMSPGALAAMVAAVVASRLIEKGGHRVVVALGALIAGGAWVWLHLGLTIHDNFGGIFLPAGMLLGVGMGMVLTGLSAVAALSVSPTQFAGATGLNLTARQIGGAFGIAVLAAILEAELSRGIVAFTDVYAFCAITSLAAAVGSVGLALRKSAPGPDAVAVEGDGALVAPSSAT